jgi:hypothetical protein
VIFQGPEYYTDYLVTAKFRERLQVTKQAAQKFDEERLNLKKLIVLEVRKQYQIITSKRLAALENSHDRTQIELGNKLKRTSKSQVKEV